MGEASAFCFLPASCQPEPSALPIQEVVKGSFVGRALLVGGIVRSRAAAGEGAWDNRRTMRRSQPARPQFGVLGGRLAGFKRVQRHAVGEPNSKLDEKEEEDQNKKGRAKWRDARPAVTATVYRSPMPFRICTVMPTRRPVCVCIVWSVCVCNVLQVRSCCVMHVAISSPMAKWGGACKCGRGRSRGCEK